MAKKQKDNEQRKEELQTNEQMDEEQEKKRFFQRFKETLENYVGEAYRIRYIENRGINHIPYKSVALHKEGKGGDWSFHLDSIYENFKKGVSIMDIILQMVLKTELTNATDVVPDGIINSFSDYESVKEYLTVRLLNMEKNEDFLKGKMYFSFLDMAVAVCFIIENSTDSVGMMNVPEWMFEKWKVSKKQVLEDAIANTERLFPPQINSAEDYIKNIMASLPKEQEEDFSKYMNPPTSKYSNIFMGSNTKGFLGTMILLYPHLLENFAKEHHAEKLLLLTASVHDVAILTNVEKYTPEMCHEVMEKLQVFETVPEAYLSNTPYLYDANSDSITIWNGEEETVQGK